MKPLSLDDLLPLDEYAHRRTEFFTAQARYLDRYRRVRVGPLVTFVFENRQTLWFRIQELLRVARLAEPDRVQQELDWYNRLLPARDRLQAALLLEIPPRPHHDSARTFWRDLDGDHLHLCVEDYTVRARLITCRPEDRCIGTAHWVEWAIDAEGRQRLADFRRPACLRLDYSSYQHCSPLLTEEIRQSLLDDLFLSDRDR